MRFGIAFSLWIAALLFVAPALADDEKPNIFMLRFGPLDVFALSEKGTIDMLAAYGYINADERDRLVQRQDLDGEKINVRFGDANMDLARAGGLAEAALRHGVDVIVSISTPVTVAAVEAIGDMEEPPLLLFNTVSNPYHAGIAKAPCIKPAWLTGSQLLPPYDRIVPLARVQKPEIKTIGVLYGAAEVNGVYGAERISEVAAQLGIRVELAPLGSVAEAAAATESLARVGVEAIMLPTETTTSNALPAILQAARKHELLLLSSVVNHVYAGAPLGAGLPGFYEEGVASGRMLVAWLNDELDASTTAINLQSGFTLAVNLDAAARHNVEIAPELVDMADLVVKAGDRGDATPELPQMSFDERRAADAAFLAGLQCTDEIIAEQQAALDAAG